MSWRAAGSLDQLLAQINAAAPSRSKVSDGSIGDAAHCPGSSDHCAENCGGVVCARDFTHDPGAGADMHQVAERLRLSRDPRIKYVIWFYRSFFFLWRSSMFSSYPTSAYPAWTWRPYSGANLHSHHLHLSVHCGPLMDDPMPWQIGGEMRLPAHSRPHIENLVRKGAIATLGGSVEKTLDYWMAERPEEELIHMAIAAASGLANMAQAPPPPAVTPQSVTLASGQSVVVRAA